MCGIAAILATGAPLTGEEELVQMTRRVSHRGPDGFGHVFLDERGVAGSAWRVALGHRRLSILDLSEEGAQPMRRDKVWVTYNGEIYNFVEVREELQRLGHAFRSSSDTEVLLAAWQQWGTACFEKLVGMWAIVLVDRSSRQVVACRDRLGIKPLYVMEQAQRIGFASELKQLAVLGALKPDLDSLRTYLETGYEDQRRTFFEQVTPLPPGTWTCWSLDDGRLLARESYWFPERVAATVEDPREAAELFSRAFDQAVREHLRSDVPVGAALSGGIDSSAVVAVVDRLRPQRLATFTATFPGAPIDERSWVEKVLSGVKAEGHFVTPTPERFLAELDAFTWHHDEPVGSLAQYAGWCVARLTREQGVPVTLNGQGGDEVLSSYWQSYMMHLYSTARSGRLLTLAMHLASSLRGNPELLRQVPVMGRRFFERRRQARSAAAAELLGSVLSMGEQERRVFEIREQYLPRLLKWDDRNFMAFGVEGRYPFLDHRLIELSLSFTPRALYWKGWMKEPLRRAMTGKLPEALVRRRSKFGFEVPQLAWMQGAMKPAIQSFLASDSPLWALANRADLQRVAADASPIDAEEQRLFRHFAAHHWWDRFFGGACARAA